MTPEKEARLYRELGANGVIEALKSELACYAASRDFWPLSLREAIARGDVEAVKAEAARGKAVIEGWLYDSHEVSTLRAESERLQSALAEARAANGALVEAATRLAECGHIYVDKPKGWTCLDIQRDAHERPTKYAPDWGAKVRSGSQLCDACRLRAALENPTEAGRAWRERLVAEARAEQRKADDAEWEEATAFASQPKTPTMREIIAEHDAKVRAAALEEAAGCFDDAYDNDVSVYENVRLLKSAVRALASPAAPPAPSEPECATCGGDGFIWRPGGGRIPDRACPDCAPSAKPSGTGGAT